MAEDRKYKNYNEFYKAGGLALFTDSELNFFKTDGGNARVDPYDYQNGVVNLGSGRKVTINFDNKGNVTGYTFTGFSGLTSSGKPTEETVNQLLSELELKTSELKNNPTSWDYKDNTKRLVDLKNVAGAAIREKHGISFMTKLDRPFEPIQFVYGDPTVKDGSLESVRGGPFGNIFFEGYIDDHTKARNINKDTDQLQSFINNSDKIRQTIVENLDTRSNVSDEVGAQTQYPGSFNNTYVVTSRFVLNGKVYVVGDEFDVSEQQMIIFSKNKIKDEKEAEQLGLEIDQIRGGFLTRDPKDGYRVKPDGTISGANPGGLLKAAQNDGVRFKPGVSTDNVNSINFGALPKTGKSLLSYTTGGGIFLDLTLGRFGPNFLKSFAHFAGHIGHATGDFLGKWYKPLYETYNFFAYGGKKTNIYNNPLTAYAIYRAIHWTHTTAGKKALQAAGKRLLVAAGLAAADGPLPVGDVAAILELIWLTADYTWSWYKEKKNEEKEEKRKAQEIKDLEKIADDLGCLKRPFVLSVLRGKARCIPCQKVQQGDFPNGYSVPDGVEVDKDGNIVYDVEEKKYPPTYPSFPNGITVRRLKPRFIWNKRDVPIGGQPFSIIQDSTKNKLNEPPIGIGLPSDANKLPTRTRFGPFWPLVPTCFPRYIKILTPNGEIPISSLNVGDFVFAFDKNGKLFERKIVSKFIHDGTNSSDVYRYFLSDQKTIDITENHPVLTNKGFEEIGQLNIGDGLIDVNNKEVFIISKEFLFNDTVYNIEVEEYNTYIADGIRVHNKNVIGIMDAVENILTPDGGTVTLDVDSDGNSSVVIVPGFNNNQEVKLAKRIADNYIQSQRESWVSNDITNRALNRSSVNGVDTTITGPLFGSRASGLDDFKKQITLDGLGDPSRELDNMRKIQGNFIKNDIKWMMLKHTGGTNNGSGNGENNQKSDGNNTVFVENGDDIIVVDPNRGTEVRKRNDYGETKPRDSSGLTACFPSFSQIKTMYGYKNIIEIIPDDDIISFNIESGIFEVTKVLKVEKHENELFEVFKYNFSNDVSINLTEEHPLLRKDSVFIKAKNLSIGDGVFNENGEIVHLESIQLVGMYNVYNLIVHRNQSYVVDGIVVRDR